MRAVLGTVMVALLAAVLPSAAVAQEAVLAYQRAIAQVCQKKVTSEMLRLYQQALREMETTNYGQGQKSNFFGLRSPERAYNDLHTGPWHGSPLKRYEPPTLLVSRPYRAPADTPGIRPRGPTSRRASG